MAVESEANTGPNLSGRAHTLIVTVDETSSWVLRSDFALRPQLELIFREHPNLQDRACGRGNITCIERLIEEKFREMATHDLLSEADSSALAALPRTPTFGGSGSSDELPIELRAKSGVAHERGKVLTFFVNDEPVELHAGPMLQAQVRNQQGLLSINDHV